MIGVDVVIAGDMVGVVNWKGRRDNDGQHQLRLAIEYMYI